jgi:Flp pilus assembly protein TadG
MKLLRASIAASAREFGADARGATAVEFGLVVGPFLLILFFILAVSFDLFQQEALDSALHIAVRQLQTGNAQNVPNGQAFVQNYICPNTQGLLNCNNIYVSVQTLANATTGLGTTTTTSGATSITDYYNFTTGTLPITGGQLNLTGSFASNNFCNSTASSYLLVTAIYYSPSIVPGLLKGDFSVQYNGQSVNAIMSQVAAISESYAPTQLSQNNQCS